MAKNVNISMSEETHLKAKKISKKVLGVKNVSGLFNYWINNYKDESIN